MNELRERTACLVPPFEVIETAGATKKRRVTGWSATVQVQRAREEFARILPSTDRLEPQPCVEHQVEQTRGERIRSGDRLIDHGLDLVDTT